MRSESDKDAELALSYLERTAALPQRLDKYLKSDVLAAAQGAGCRYRFPS